MREVHRLKVETRHRFEVLPLLKFMLESLKRIAAQTVQKIYLVQYQHLLE